MSRKRHFNIPTSYTKYVSDLFFFFNFVSNDLGNELRMGKEGKDIPEI